MRRAAFERLTSAWLDEPGSASLQQRIATAIAADEHLGQLLRQWCRLDALLRGALPPAPAPGPRLRERVAHRLEQHRDRSPPTPDP